MEHEIKITIPSDERGFSGRECPKCKQPFKLKLGTGLPTNYCHCPYCDCEGDGANFHTPEQLEYARSMMRKVAYERFIRPALNDLRRSFKQLERHTANSLFKLKVKINATEPLFHIKHYKEKEVETDVYCDNCGLEFAICGVFVRCPDCEKLNAFTVFKKSIEVSGKLLNAVTSDETDDLVEAQLKSVLSNAVSSFDGLGKALKNQFAFIPKRPKNLFQNLLKLSEIWEQHFKTNLLPDEHDRSLLIQMFQVRHVYEHSMGVIDDDFIRILPHFAHMKGRKYKLTNTELSSFLVALTQLTDRIEETVGRNRESHVQRHIR